MMVEVLQLGRYTGLWSRSWESSACEHEEEMARNSQFIGEPQYRTENWGVYEA